MVLTYSRYGLVLIFYQTTLTVGTQSAGVNTFTDLYLQNNAYYHILLINKKNEYLIISRYKFPYNISTAFHNYALLWDLDNNVKVYADNVLILSGTGPDARFGTAGFGMSFLYY